MITNYLQPTSFSLVIQRIPNVEFFTQMVNIPGLNTGTTETLTPLNTLYTPKTGLNYADLDVTFVIDENMKNYKEIYYWIEQNALPQNQTAYNAELSTSDISIILNSSAKNPNQKFTFIDCFPTDLSAINLDIKNQDVIYPEVTATFKYTYFNIDDVDWQLYYMWYNYIIEMKWGLKWVLTI